VETGGLGESGDRDAVTSRLSALSAVLPAQSVDSHGTVGVGVEAATVDLWRLAMRISWKVFRAKLLPEGGGPLDLSGLATQLRERLVDARDLARPFLRILRLIRAEAPTMGRYLELADEALRRAEPRRPASPDKAMSRASAGKDTSPPTVARERYGEGSDACSACGRTDWIASLVADDGTRLCARCCLGQGPR
jgi:hypothetical protein